MMMRNPKKIECAEHLVVASDSLDVIASAVWEYRPRELRCTAWLYSKEVRNMKQREFIEEVELD